MHSRTGWYKHAQQPRASLPQPTVRTLRRLFLYFPFLAVVSMSDWIRNTSTEVKTILTSVHTEGEHAAGCGGFGVSLADMTNILYAMYTAVLCGAVIHQHGTPWPWYLTAERWEKTDWARPFWSHSRLPHKSVKSACHWCHYGRGWTATSR